MAPSIDVLQPQQQAVPAPAKGPGGPYDYKEVAISSMKDYSAHGELNGVGKFAKASYPNYLPDWDPETR